ncbi:response regulator transcription factor [Terriglobus tenax]|uniref:response regulator transcription factor n=1 Tax=Terriglobus tenax TaxID=1111115 RepID=UPI0021E0936E|nr:response regulator transcription factor [Terriglobus tenax]
MVRVILGDNEAIFRAGMARVLVRDDNLRIVAQCGDQQRLLEAVRAYRSSVVLAGRSMFTDLPQLFDVVAEAGSRLILVLEKGERPTPEVAARLFGVVHRNVDGQTLVERVRQVARGQRASLSTAAEPSKPENIGQRIRQKLTPREMQVVSLIVQGCRNKEIATQLGTKEQVVKNYLRSVYGKVGVSDRLELALFAIHHQVVPEEAAAS